MDDLWIAEMEQATACLRTGDENTTQAALDSALVFLQMMEHDLMKIRPSKWHQVPGRSPPSWQSVLRKKKTAVAPVVDHDHNDAATNIGPMISGLPAYRGNQPHGGNGQNRNRSINTNPFLTLQQDDEDDDSEAGDYPVLNISTSSSKGSSSNNNNDNDNNNDMVTVDTQRLDIRRLLLRLLTFLSDLRAAKARFLRKESHWTLGAKQLAASLEHIHAALNFADEEISMWFQYPNNNNHHHNRNNNQQQRQQQQQEPFCTALMEDAHIVSVAVESLTNARDQYQQAAVHQEHWLQKKLAPQWEARDQVKARMGEDKWNNNPRPKHEFTKLRANHERMLRDVQNSLEYLERLDTSLARESSKNLHDKLWNPKTNKRNDRDRSPNVAAMSRHRYNGQRPLATALTHRVSFLEYPDPTVFGWIFTGSHNVTEFFERTADDGSNSLIKLDWYFTTATVKTSLDHPVQGSTQLFGAKVNPKTYQSILENPRKHTGQRYHTKKGKTTTKNENGSSPSNTISNNNYSHNGKRNSQRTKKPLVRD